MTARMRQLGRVEPIAPVTLNVPVLQ